MKSETSAQFAMAARLLHHDDEELEWEAYRGAAEDARAAGHPLGRDSRTPSPTKMEEESSDRSFLSWFTPPRLGTRELAGQATLTRRERARRRWRKMSADHIGLWTEVPVHPPYRGRREMRMLDLLKAVDAPTDEHRWFSPRHGWPPVAGQPPPMTPTAAHEPSLFPDDDEVLGTLYVEVIEARGLAKLDKFSENDTYAVVCFEGYAARTCTLEDQDPPRWHADTPRAFAFPITAPHAPLHVALLEEDEAADFLGKSAMNKTGAAGRALTSLAGRAAQATKINAVVEDTPIGRATVRLGALHGRAVYDGWYPLQQTVNTRHVGQHGEVRLRIRVEWKGERRRLLASLAAAPETHVPIIKRVGRKMYDAADFTVHGSGNDAKFDLDIFKSHARELLLLTWAPNVMSDIVHHAIYYESPTLSLLLCGWWQLVCSRPNLMPACWPLAALAFLSQTYQARRRAGRLARAKRGVRAEPSFLGILLLLLLPQFISRRLPPPRPPTYHEQALAGGADDEEEEEEGDGYISEGPSATPRPEPLATKVTAAVKAERTAEVAAEENWSRKLLQGADDDDDDDESQHSDTRPRASSSKNLLRRPSSDGAKFTVGARVSHYSHRVGTVTEVLPSPEGSVTVRFDNGETHHYKTRSQWKLRELSYGDDFTSEGVQSVNSPGRNSPTKMVTRFVSEMGDRTIDATKKVGNRTREAAKSVEKLGKDATGALLDATQGVTDATVGVAKMALSPLEYFLFPYQQWIGKYLVYLRQTRALLQWEDPVQTSLLCLQLLVVSIVFALLPWQLMMRVGGAVLLGPHMWVVGARRRRKAAADARRAAERERRYRRAVNEQDEVAARTVFDEAFQEAMAAAKAEAAAAAAAKKAAEAKRPARLRARMAAQTRPQYDALHVPTSTVPIERYGTRYRGIASREAAWLN